ncbi:MAG TPA: iron chelate uptake ABC transporter family permease subunit [Myxococcota bacterium]|nr:iron chelate uptake ABC transporter family permease subunit [Myxococcota bacterium]
MHQLGISDLMLRAFLECLILVGIHAYLGLHVIRRKVIFVDLALAQVAALGTTVGFLFNMAPDSTAALLFSMLFTFVAAALFAITRTRRDRVPQEAIIGVVFAIAAAVIILVVDRAPHGAEHIKEVMTGAILWVRWDAIILAACTYSVVGLFHYIFRKPILAISEDPDKAKADGIRLWVWDFWFYLSFGLVISISVRTAGVLLVFVFLVVPAIIASLITSRLLYQLLVGWGMGFLVTVLGLGTSYLADMPAGPSVVAFYGIVLGLAALIIHVVRAGDRRRALVRVTVGTLVALAIVGFVWFSGWALSRTELARSSRGHDHPHRPALSSAAAEPQAHAASDDLAELEKAFDNAADSEMKLTYAQKIATHDRRRGAERLLSVLRTAEVPFVREEALAALSKLAGKKFTGVDTEKDYSQNTADLREIEDWVGSIQRGQPDINAR